MKIEIPIQIEKQRRSYRVRSLFVPGVAPISSAKLSRALNTLRHILREHLSSIADSDRHEELSRLLFNPPIRSLRISFKMELRQGDVRLRCLVGYFACMDRQIGFAPNIPDLWFEIPPGHSVARTAEAAIRKWIQKKADVREEDPGWIEDCATDGRASLDTLGLELKFTQALERSRLSPREFRLDGFSVLDRVGTCLDRLYPEELMRGHHCEDEVAELTRLLNARQRRPILIVGRRGVGKTTVLHEYIRQRWDEWLRNKDNRGSPGQSVWHLSPQRLISGASQVGQWEARLLAILEVAERKAHTLYFDDLLGLFHAGISAESDLCIANVLGQHLDKGKVRILGEITPDGLARMQELDRGFADRFHLLRIAEPTSSANLRIQIRTIQELEADHLSRFSVEALPCSLDLTNRFFQDQASPGKCADFLRQLATRFPDGDITRSHVLEGFHAHSGLRLDFLDSQRKLPRQEILDNLSADVIGQKAALEALANRISIARAHLGDSGRPMAAFLFLGPTGVGKTHTAKAAARYLLGDDDRLIRFDMNEFVSAASVSQLIGTFDRPDGQLTSAVRRQPFSVLLLDEIEKAHPNVFDLLLQVLGEGRLSDARGETVSFANTLIIMTSNIGARKVQGQIGFGEEAAGDKAIYMAACERFFRPEFIGRLDEIIPFGRLSRPEMRRIVDLEIRRLFHRDGLVQRRVPLDIAPAALDLIVDQGYHPELGVRALKRTIETHMTQPIAARLATLSPDRPFVIRVDRSGDDLQTHVDPLQEAGAGQPGVARESQDSKGMLAHIAQVVDSISDRVRADSAESVIDLTQIDAGELSRYAVDDMVQHIQSTHRILTDKLDEVEKGARLQRASPKLPTQPGLWYQVKDQSSSRQWLAALFSHEDITDFWSDLSAHAKEIAPSDQQQILKLYQDTSLLTALAGEDDAPGVWPREQRILFLLRTVHASFVQPRQLLDLFRKVFEEIHACAVQELPEVTALVLQGPAMERIARVEEGTHAFMTTDDNLVPVQVIVSPLTDDADPMAAVESAMASTPYGPVLRLYGEGEMTIDYRSGLSTRGFPDAASLRRMLLSQLPAPGGMY